MALAQAPDAVAVVADLKNSTKLGTGKWASSTARVYEASTGGVVKIIDQFDADFLAIQGDGAFRRSHPATCQTAHPRQFRDVDNVQLCEPWIVLVEQAVARTSKRLQHRFQPRSLVALLRRPMAPGMRPETGQLLCSIRKGGVAADRRGRDVYGGGLSHSGKQ